MPQRVTSYDLLVRSWGNRKFDPPKPLIEVDGLLRSPRSSTVYQLVQRYGRAAEAGNRPELEESWRLLQAKFTSREPVAFDVVKRSYDPMDRAQGAGVEPIRVPPASGVPERLEINPGGPPMSRLVRSIFRRLRSSSHEVTHGAFSAIGSRAAQGRLLIRAFYAFVLFMAVTSIPEFAGLAQSRELSLLWPVAWLDAVDPVSGIRFLLGFFLAASVAVAFWPGSRILRAAAFVGLLCFVALKNSEGKIGHSLHLPVLLALIFILLPDGWERPGGSRVRRMSTLQVLAAAQMLLLLTYTMSGLGKLGGGLYELLSGQAHPLQIDGFSRIVAERLLQTNSHSVLGQWMIGHPWLGWLLFPGAIYLQTTSLIAACRPSLHRTWGAALILFHIGNALILTIYFPQSVFLLGLFLLASPFAPASFDARRFLADLPLLSFLSRVLPTRAVPPSNEVT